MREKCIWILLCVLLCAGVVAAQDAFTGITTTGLNVRETPSTRGRVVAALEIRTTIVVEGRNAASEWLHIHTQDNAHQGWVASRYVTLQNVELGALPVVDDSAGSAPANTAPVAASGDLSGLAVVNLNVRSAPAAKATKLGLLEAGTTVSLMGRTPKGDWIYVSGGGLQGWIASGYLRLPGGVTIAGLPAIDPNTATSVVAAPPVVASNPPANNTNNSVSAPPLPNVAIPDSSATGYIVMPEAVIAHSREIFQLGQSLGNSPTTFIKIGDSNMNWSEYLCPFNSSSYNLGSYGYLQGIINTFQPSGSFCANNNSAQPGFVSNAVTDAYFVINPACNKDETPIACDLRLQHPSFAFIYIGVLDMNYIPAEAFAMNIDNIVTYLSGKGVVPILSTFTIDDWRHDGRATLFNDAIRRVAAGRQVPLMDIQAALYNFPQRGTREDGYHLSRNGDGNSTSFNGDENTYGRARRELMTLQLLDTLYARVR